MVTIKEEGGGVLGQTNSRNQDPKPSQLEDGVLELGYKDPKTQHPRDGILTWKWALTCAGLYIGALLYGLLHSTNEDDNSHANTGTHRS